MAEQLIPFSSPTTIVSGDRIPTSTTENTDPFSTTDSINSPGGSDYSVIDYNIPNMFAHELLASTAEKHSRSVNNSPQKTLKKAKYDTNVRISDGNEDSFFGYASETSDKENMHIEHNAKDIIINGDKHDGYNEDDSIVQKTPGSKRDSIVRTPRSDATTPTRSNLPKQPSSVLTSNTATPRARELPARLATLSPYSDSPDSSPAKTPTNERTQNLLLDFTQQFNNVKSYQYDPETPTKHHRSQSASPTKRYQPNAVASPTKKPLPVPTHHDRRFLLDFDIPPPPTPRSIPSITPKELENLKSTYLAQVASLKAELAGKDTEITSLKKSISETERRYASNTVELRQCREENEDLSARGGVLESKLQEASRVLSEARDEIADRGKQIEHLKDDYESAQQELDYTRKQFGDAQQQLVDTKQDLASVQQKLIMEQQKQASISSTDSNASTTSADVESAVSKAVAAVNATKEADITASVEKVAKELHALYKSKHEQKVSALKASYGARWEKRVKELEVRNADLASANNDLNAQLCQIEEAREESLTGPFVSHADAEAHKGEVKKLTESLEEAQETIKKLQEDIDLERQEKGELVLAVDELMAMGGLPAGVGSISKGSGAQLVKSLATPMKSEPDWKTSSLRGGIERMANGASASSSRFGLR